MEFILGRSPKGENVRKIDNSYVSANHCRIWLDKESNIYYIEDLGSTNGTFVNGLLVKQMAIKGDDKILLGGEGGYGTTLEKLLATSDDHIAVHKLDDLRKIYEDYQRDMSKFKINAQVYQSLRIIPTVITSVILAYFVSNDQKSVAIVTAGAVVLCIVISTVLIRKNDAKMRERITRFQLTYVCPKTRRFYGDRSWEVLQNEQTCSFCREKFE
mgnify:CR=1 FL=1